MPRAKRTGRSTERDHARARTDALEHTFAGRRPGGAELPEKWLPARAATFVTNLERGAHVSTAARAAGIGSKETIYRWLRQGREDGAGPLHAFARTVDEYRARAELKLLDIVTTAGAEDWKAAAWLLERRYRSRWADEDEVRINREVERRMAQALADAEARKAMALNRAGAAMLTAQQHAATSTRST